MKGGMEVRLQEANLFHGRETLRPAIDDSGSRARSPFPFHSPERALPTENVHMQQCIDRIEERKSRAASSYELGHRTTCK